MFARFRPRVLLTSGGVHGPRQHSSTRGAAVVYESTSLDPYFNLAFEDW